jgi:proteasome accessory factor B
MSEQEALTKAERYMQICRLLYHNPHGLTSDALAQRCGVTQRTIERDLIALEHLRVPIWDDGERPSRYHLSEGYYVPPLRLTSDDALALYLAARLLAQYADTFDPHISEALVKLATVLPEPVSRHIHTTIDNLCVRTSDDLMVQVLGVLGRGWAMGRKVRLIYWAADRQLTKAHVIRPYFLEPSALSNATYVIGFDEEAQDLRTFKVERVQHAELLNETFTIPEDFDAPTLLDSCWGIMYGPELEQVVLRFAPSVTRRVKETCWHPSQKLEETADGGCVLTVAVANPVEMTYWVRGWGAGVEVLAPASLRESVIDGARQLAKLYGV